jgi:hypothetical protein
MAGRFELIEEEAAPSVSENRRPKRFELVDEKPVLPTAYVGKTPEQIASMRARDEAQAQEASDKMRLSTLSPAMRQAASAAQSAGEMFGGAFDYIPAAGAKLLGKAGVSGYEGYADQPLFDIKEQSRQLGEAAKREYPKTGMAGSAVGLAGSIAGMPVFGGKLGTVPSGAITGGIYGGVDEGMREGTISGAMHGAGVGTALGATISPIVEKAIGAASNKFGLGRKIIDSSGNLSDEAIETARAAGMSPDEIRYYAPELADLYRERGFTPEAAREAQFREFGITPSQGMVSLSPKQLAKEAAFRDYEPIVAQAAQSAETAVGGQQPALRDAVEAAVNRGVAGAAALKRQYQNAYKTAAATPGEFDVSAITDVGDHLLARLANDPKALAFRNSSLVQEAAAKLNTDLGQPLALGVGKNAPTTIYKNFGAVEEARKGLNQYLSRASDSTDRAGMRRLIDEFDKHVESSIINGAFSGDPGVAAEWRNARGLFAKYQDKFGVKRSGDMSGRLLNDIIERSRSPEEVANMMFRFSETGDASAKESAIKTFFQLRRALGPRAPEIETIRRSFVQNMMTPTIPEGKAASPDTFAKTAKRIDAFLNGPQAGFSRRMFSADERAMMARYASVMRAAATKAPRDVTPTLGLFGQIAGATAPVVAEAAMASLGYLHPGLAAAIAPMAAFWGRGKAIAGSEALARRAAQAMPGRVPRVDTSGIRTAVPINAAGLATPSVDQAYGSVSPLVEQEYDRTFGGNREGRATGGSVGITADRLIAMAKASRRKIQGRSKAILSQPDEHVVSALKAVNKQMQGQ